MITSKRSQRASIILIMSLVLVACATYDGMRLSDLGSRYWKGTYYLSVVGTTTSITCKVNPSYNSPDDVKVYYKEQDAEPLFPLDEDIQKIEHLKHECFTRSFGNSLD